jgi:predicted flavoprotein YhiN
VEGSLIYAASALLRDRIAAEGHATFELDLLPQLTLEQVLAKLQSPRGSKSLTSHLKARLGLDGIKTAVLFEFLSKEELAQPERLTAAIKGLPIRLGAARPIDEAISSAGGVCWDALDDGLMLKALPGVYCVGEMVDWEAPTGGYLLTACLSSGRWAAQALLQRLG